jgi:hypothetical protein
MSDTKTCAYCNAVILVTEDYVFVQNDTISTARKSDPNILEKTAHVKCLATGGK